MSERIERLIRAGDYDEAIAALRETEPEDERFDVDEAVLESLLDAAVVRLRGEVPGLVNAAVAAAVARARGRAD